ncbi:DegT/DnrJ/EryC1/StrS family aminotransferase [Paenibacillus sp. LMG 31456]|uniref:DegT/DnrJ/EryC1/StrS family aminotransferase n=1 Tax=Paenibacillus foliorum TaxID=2654974 RepID=A0A972K2Y5_9BACL|nr:DegT/DnrJ/EryC1/StrS family aminotransferase [Paenibacillus foliorum]NOU97236.1 DegT/DnrJ/EryC1/StrS family aminotransferase [Paenibacillus foliorum]
MFDIPFLKPKLVVKEDYMDYLKQIDDSRSYSNYGALNTLFEQRLIRELFNGQGSAVTVNNATTGLILSISQLKRRGKYALMPSFTFAATPLAAMWCGLEPYFIDVCEKDWCMNEELLEKEINRLGDEVAVVIPYATFGTNLDTTSYEALQDRGIPVVIDAAASMGSKLTTHFGQGFTGAVVYSFHATKGFGIGEGGLIYSSDKEMINKVRQASNFGFNEDRESKQMGINGKLSEYAAAIGLATLEVFEQKKLKREQVFGWYMEGLEQLGLMEQGWQHQEVKGSVAYSFLSLLCPETYRNTHFVERLASSGIQTRTYFSPSCHQQALFQSYPRTLLHITEQIGRRIINLPLWEDMNQGNVETILQGLSHEG